MSVEFEGGPIFIVGNSKSGTTLVQSLLDDHPDLCVVPIEFKLFKFANLPSLPPGNMPPHDDDYKVPIPRNDVSPGRVIEEVVSHADFEDIKEGRPVGRGVEIKKSYLDRKDLFKCIQEANPNNIKQVYVSLLQAFHSAMDVETDFQETLFVVKTPQLEEYAVELRAWFDNCYFLHTLRNPYANIHSLRSAGTRTRYLKRVYARTAKSYYFLERNKRYISNYNVVKYEDVVLSTEKALKDICGNIPIEYNPSLKKPTILGKPWGGNSRTTGEKFDAIDPRPVDKYEEEISYLDIALINKYFSRFIEEHGYSSMESPGLKSLLPSGVEFPLTYLRNRVLLRSGSAL